MFPDSVLWPSFSSWELFSFSWCGFSMCAVQTWVLEFRGVPSGMWGRPCAACRTPGSSAGASIAQSMSERRVTSVLGVGVQVVWGCPATLLTEACGLQEHSGGRANKPHFSTLPGSVNTVISPWEHWWLSFKWTAHWAPAERQYRQLQEAVTGSCRQTGSFSVPTLGVILLSVPGHLKVTR